MPELAATAAPVVDAGPSTSEDEELEALIRGGEAGAAPKAPTGQESDEDLEALIRGGSSDGGADSAPSTPAPKPGQETDEDLEKLIRGN